MILGIILMTTEGPPPPPPSPPTLHIVGDSQACGAGLVAGKVAELKAWPRVKVTCRGGTPVRYWSEHIDDAGLKPGDSVLIYLGSNDWGGSPDASVVLAKVKASGAKCVWVGPPLIRGKDGAAPRLMEKVRSDKTCAYLDSRELHLQQPDGVHTSEPARWLRAGVAKLSQGR